MYKMIILIYYESTVYCKNILQGTRHLTRFVNDDIPLSFTIYHFFNLLKIQYLIILCRLYFLIQVQTSNFYFLLD